LIAGILSIYVAFNFALQLKPTTVPDIKFFSKTLLSLFILIDPLFSYCQQTTDTIPELDPVTVTASLYPENISKTGRNIIIIKGEQFSKLPVHSIDELLRYLPGIEIQQRGPMGSQADIVMRGSTFQQVLVVLDGIRLNDPNTGHFNSYIPIAPSEIDRIEVLKGASSAIFGSDAVGGVINIITKTFAAKMKGNEKEINAFVVAGEYALINTNAGFFYHDKKTAISGGILSDNTNGQPQRGTRGYFNNNTASFSVSHYFNFNWSLSLRTAYDSRKFSAQNFYTTFTSDTANEKVKTSWSQLKLVYEKEKNKFSLNAGYKYTQDEYSFNSGISPNNNKSVLTQTEAIFKHSFSANTSLTTGTQFINNSIGSNDRGDHHINQAALFTILNQTIAGHLFISPALRFDWDERGGTELVPQVNFSYKQEKVQYRMSIGKTIRQADFTERFNNYNKALVTSGSIGNPDLQAEHSLSYEAGADFFAAKSLKISATLFRRVQKNVIDWVTTLYSQMPRKDNLSPTGTYALASNIADVHTSGAEMDIQYTKRLTHQQQLSGMLGFILLHTNTSEATTSFYISSHAKFLTNFSFEYSNKIIALTLNGIYKQREPQEASAINAKIDADYFILNGRADFFVWQQRLSVFAELDNITNNKIQDLLGSQLPGRWLMGGVSLMLD
jgi:iron complex outermembrane receptor protein